jgi:DNA-binding beta-propeller fold protein YncE
LGTYGRGEGQFAFPIGIAVDEADKVYVVDATIHRVQVFDRNGEFLREWGTYGRGEGQFAFPIGIAVDGVGNVYVVDSILSRVQVFDPNGEFLRSWGAKATATPSSFPLLV